MIIPKEFHGEVETLKDLISQSKVTFLIGAGCSKCAGLASTKELKDHVLVSKSSRKTKAILNYLKRNLGDATIEDYLSELADIISIVERRCNCNSEQREIILNRVHYSKDELKQALEEIKRAIVQCLKPKDIDILTHRKFVRALHTKLKASDGISSPTIDYFLLNYDNLVEDALALERIPYTDGFRGGTTGWWDPCLLDLHSQDHGFNKPVDIAARVVKIHGSIDWCLLDGESIPRRAPPNLLGNGQLTNVMIWPAATKYRETQNDPYAQMIAILRDTLHPLGGDGSEVVLIICGYSFGDSHINFEIDRALRESNQKLTVLVFSSEKEPTGILKKWMADPEIKTQVRIHSNRGFFHGENQKRSSEELLWWRFELLTQLLGGEQ
jgi:hypothetical protein